MHAEYSAGDIALDGITEGTITGEHTLASFSADARYCDFNSYATNLVTGTTAAIQEVYLRDTCNGVPSGCTPSTKLVSTTDGGVVDFSTNFTGSRSLTLTDGLRSLSPQTSFTRANKRSMSAISARATTSRSHRQTTKVSVDTLGLAGTTQDIVILRSVLTATMLSLHVPFRGLREQRRYFWQGRDIKLSQQQVNRQHTHGSDCSRCISLQLMRSDCASRAAAINSSHHRAAHSLKSGSLRKVWKTKINSASAGAELRLHSRLSLIASSTSEEINALLNN